MWWCYHVLSAGCPPPGWQGGAVGRSPSHRPNVSDGTLIPRSRPTNEKILFGIAETQSYFTQPTQAVEINSCQLMPMEFVPAHREWRLEPLHQTLGRVGGPQEYPKENKKATLTSTE